MSEGNKGAGSVIVNPLDFVAWKACRVPKPEFMRHAPKLANPLENVIGRACSCSKAVLQKICRVEKASCPRKSQTYSA